MNKVYSFLLLISIWSCNSSDCFFNDSFLSKQEQKEFSLIITKGDSTCQDLKLDGDFFNYNTSYKISKPVSIQDSLYVSSDNILFDFSQNKKSGILQLNDTLKVKIDFLYDIPFENENYRLFKTTAIDKYYKLDLFYVYITHYRYGIVGEFVLGKENDEWFSLHQKGYIPNKDLFYTIFKKGELL